MTQLSLVGRALRRRTVAAPGFLLLLLLGAALVGGLALGVAAGRPRPVAAILLIWMVLETVLALVLLSIAWRRTASPAPAGIAPAGVAPPRRPPTITTLIPAWNAGRTLHRTVADLLTRADPPDRIIVVDDGSDDGSIARLCEQHEVPPGGEDGPPSRSAVHSRLEVLRKPHSGKADSLNRGLAHCRSDLVMVLDADTRPLPGAVARLRACAAERPRHSVFGGVLIPVCDRTPLGRLMGFLQRREYVSGQAWRLAWSSLDATLLVAGACCAFRTGILRRVGGFSCSSWTEDYEVMFRLHRDQRRQGAPLRVWIEPGFLARTEAPSGLLAFLRQRRRWAGGVLETLTTHADMVGNRRYGALGLAYLAWNTLALVQPLAIALLLLVGITLYRTPFLDSLMAMVGLVLVVRYGLSVLLAQLMLLLYRRSGSGHGVGAASMALHALAQPFFYGLLLLAAQLWGSASVLLRRRSW